MSIKYLQTFHMNTSTLYLLVIVMNIDEAR